MGHTSRKETVILFSNIFMLSPDVPSNWNFRKVWRANCIFCSVKTFGAMFDFVMPEKAKQKSKACVKCTIQINLTSLTMCKVQAERF